MQVPGQVRAALQSLLGSKPGSWRGVTGGCSPAGRARVGLADGRSVFAKWAADEDTSKALRAEWRVYREVRGDFMPRVFGYVEDPGLLVIEDLGDLHWPPPWREDEPRRAVEALRRAQRCAAPDGLPKLESFRDFLTGWRNVAEDPAPFLGLGAASEEWLAAALPKLLAAEAAVVLEGDDFLHFDARGDNLCIGDDGRVVFVDWNWACVGNGAFDLAQLAVSIRADGGPEPDRLLDDDGGAAALLAGFYASRAGLPPIPEAPAVRDLQRHCLGAALPWAARVLGLPAPC
jgi:hypothetical protein